MKPPIRFSAARMARAQGARVVYSAAPFEAKAAAEVLPFVNILCANEHEVEALQQAQRMSSLASLGLDGMLITYGAKGAAYHDFSQIRCLRLREFLSPPSIPPERATRSADIS